METSNIDELSTLDMVKVFNREDKKVAKAVEEALPKIAQAVDCIAIGLKKGGRLFYIGSGTGGKIGVLDATECPPTFGVDDNVVIGIISGGKEALCGWREETEDDEILAVNDLKAQEFAAQDILVAISAGGNTPYVLSAVHYAKGIGSQVIGVCCRAGSCLESIVDICITADVGSEVISGSTRLKGGTAQKMILNMLSSGSMIKMGKVYNNLMVEVRPINRKLRRRIIEIVQLSTGCLEETASKALFACEGSAKIAILMLKKDIDAKTARLLLEKHNGYLKRAISGEII